MNSGNINPINGCQLDIIKETDMEHNNSSASY